jgi:hypothetical protein
MDETQPGMARLGAGTIISATAVLTAAHLVDGYSEFQIGHGWMTTGSMLRRIANVINIAQGYDPLTFANDLAIILLPQGITFNLFSARLNAALLPAEGAAPSAEGYAIGWGFTAPGANAMSASPYEATLSVGTEADCLAMLPPDTVLDPETQVCYTGTEAVACPGDGGSGLYTPGAEALDPADLIGVLSVVSSTCASGAAVLIQGFTTAHIEWMIATANIPPTPAPEGTL